MLELLDDLSPEVNADEARGVMTAQTPRGPIHLWVAPTNDGGFCAYIEGGTQDSSACGNDADFGLPRPGLSMDLRDKGLAFGRVIGWTPGDRVELELGDGRRLPARIVDGWVLQGFPERETLVRIQLLRAGAIVATQEMLPPKEIPVMPAPGEYRALLEVETFAGETAVLSVAPTSPGQQCYRVSAGSSESASCGDPPLGDVAASGDLTKGLLFGPVQVPATSLEVVFEDGARADVPFKDGYFLYAVPKEHLKRGALPKEFVARDASGKVVGRGPAAPGG